MQPTITTRGLAKLFGVTVSTLYYYDKRYNIDILPNATPIRTFSGKGRTAKYLTTEQASQFVQQLRQVKTECTTTV